MRTIRTFKFNGEQMSLVDVGRYMDDTPALSVLCEDGSPYARITVCMEGQDATLSPQQCIVKTWSENEPIAAALLELGIFRDTGGRIGNGFVDAQIWELV